MPKSKGSEVADEPEGHENEGGFVRFTIEQYRRILNLLDVADQLEKFTLSDKVALKTVIQDAPELHAMVESRAFWEKCRRKGKWFLVQCGAIIAGLTALNEAWTILAKWHLHP